MTNYLVIGDVHGKLDSLTALLQYWKPAKEQLILLGDLVDRGLQSREVIQLAMTLKEEYGAIILKGNHDDMFLHWLQTPENYLYYAQGGDMTVNSFFDTRMSQIYHADFLADRIKNEFPKELAFLASLPDYHDADPFIMVHAGVDLTMLDWKETHPEDFKWIRHDFHYDANKTGRTILFGHTPTRFLNKDASNDIWLSPCQTKIGLDGGAVFGSYLHGLRIVDNKPIEVVSVNHELVCDITPFNHRSLD